MANPNPNPAHLFIFLCFFPLLINSQALQTYIVQLRPNSQSSKPESHLAFLDRAIGEGEDPNSRLLYSYGSAMEGFSAVLTTQEAEFLRKLHDVIAVRPDNRLQLHTTYSYKFLGLGGRGSGRSAWAQSGFGRGSVIGVLDTGVWPESPSFNDKGMDPVPKTWKGSCQEGQNFSASSCNKKLIGAKFFIKGHHVAALGAVSEYVSPRDSVGHGTHTASTAGGSPVADASVLGNGEGEARGMASGAHIAVYKVCWFGGCYSSDILAGMDSAIRDGVHVMSLSLGGFPVPLYDDSIAIGSFRAMERGISVVCAAGNNGPIQGSVANEAPWITTVGASTLDRRFPAYVRMGNGKYLYGESVYSGKNLNFFPRESKVVYVSGGNSGSEFCIEDSLPESVVKGKIVVCDRGINGRAAKGEVVKKAGGIAMILANTEFNLEEDSVDPHLLPATQIGYYEAVSLKSYVNSTVAPTARILFFGTVLGKGRAPSVARFSSRGPSISNPSIIKPDVIAPGVNIIAAWPQNLGLSGLPDDSRRGNFTIMSGTSMACPHVSGITALVRAAHPGWSTAALKSAIMTSADVMDRYGKPIMDGNVPANVFAMGSGHINPTKAINPGLVYDIKADDYVTHLCALGYAKSEIFTITHRNVSCGEIMARNKGFSLNYPSISVMFKKGVRRMVVKRQLTNVGEPDSAYSVKFDPPKGVKISVRPKQLVFKSVGQSLTYKVYAVLMKEEIGAPGSSQGYLAWVNCADRSKVVRSPISVTRMN